MVIRLIRIARHSGAKCLCCVRNVFISSKALLMENVPLLTARFGFQSSNIEFERWNNSFGKCSQVAHESSKRNRNTFGFSSEKSPSTQRFSTDKKSVLTLRGSWYGEMVVLKLSLKSSGSPTQPKPVIHRGNRKRSLRTYALGENGRRTLIKSWTPERQHEFYSI